MSKKNVIWYLVDQLRADALGINGDLNARTPNLDNFAKQGVNFTKATCGFPLCCPNRGSLLTGQHPITNGVTGHEYPLTEEKPTIADSFRNNGYETVYFGKWHLAGLSEENGAVRTGTMTIPKSLRGRFDTFVGYDNNNSPFDCYVHGHMNNQELPLYKLPGYEVDAVTDLAIDEIKRQASKQRKSPFFMVVSVQPPHDPYIAPAEYLDHFDEHSIKLKANVPPIESVTKTARRDLKGYYAALECIDHNFARMLDALEEKGLYEDTHIIFLSDHGDMHGSHGLYRKTNPYQESVAVPLLLGGGGKMNYNEYQCGEDDILISSVDVPTTSLGLCGIDIPAHMNGHDLSGRRLKHKETPQDIEAVMIESIIPTYHPDSTNKSWRGIVTNIGYKYVCFEDAEWLMFDLNNDPNELVNLVHNSTYGDIRKRLNVTLRQMCLERGDDIRLPVITATDLEKMG